MRSATRLTCKNPSTILQRPQPRASMYYRIKPLGATNAPRTFAPQSFTRSTLGASAYSRQRNVSGPSSLYSDGASAKQDMEINCIRRYVSSSIIKSIVLLLNEYVTYHLIASCMQRMIELFKTPRGPFKSFANFDPAAKAEVFTATFVPDAMLTRRLFCAMIDPAKRAAGKAFMSLTCGFPEMYK